MLAKSQGVELSQEWFVERVYGPTRPCLPTFGRFELIRKAITGKFQTAEGAWVTLTGAYNYGPPTNPAGMIKSILEGRPFLFAWEGHIYVCYGLRWHEAPLRVVELKLIDPMWKYGRSKYRTFNVFRHSTKQINGTFELLVAK